MEDNYIHKGLRKKLVEIIIEKGISNKLVLEAISNIPRHLFIGDSALFHHAYEDKAFPIGAGQTISQPYTVAFQTELLQLEKGHKVLEIGTGSGYQAAVLAELKVKIYSIERQKELYIKTKNLLNALGYKNINLFYGDGYKGLTSFAPFDRIIITAAAPFIPQDLLLQLKIGGIMVIPLGEGNVQKMTTITKKSETEFIQTEFGDFRFVPMLKDKS